MSKSLVFLAAVFLFAVSARAQELKLGFVDDRAILEKLPAKQEVQKILDQETAFWEQRFSDRRGLLKVYLDSVTAAQTALEKAGEGGATAAEPEKQQSSPASALNPSAQTDSSGSPAATGGGEAATGQQSQVPADTLELLVTLERLERELDKSKKEIVALYHQIYGRNGILKQRNAELSQSILEKVNRSISDVCQEVGVSLVFDSSALLYIDQDNNYTEQVLEALNIKQTGAR